MFRRDDVEARVQRLPGHGRVVNKPLIVSVSPVSWEQDCWPYRWFVEMGNSARSWEEASSELETGV